MTSRSPQAHNWLRQTRAVALSYSVAVVPSQLKDGYLHYFDNVIRRRKYIVLSHRYRFNTVQDMLHTKSQNDLHAKREEFIQKYPHTRDLFGGLQYLIVNRNDGRPASKGFDEDEFLAGLRRTMMTEPQYPNSYADEVRYNLGNGVVTALPILIVHVNIELSAVPIQL